MSMFLDSSRTLPDTKEGLGNPDMSGILLDSPTLLLSWPGVNDVSADVCGALRGSVHVGDRSAVPVGPRVRASIFTKFGSFGLCFQT